MGAGPFEHAEAHVRDLESFVESIPESGAIELAGYAWMITGVPYSSSGSSRSRVVSETRTHPALTLRPIDEGLFVPWIASWFPPDQPAGRRGWMPLIPNANDPRALPAEKGTRSVTKYSPTGRGR